MSSSEADSDSGSSAMTSMVIACSSALVIFGVIYYIFDRRAKEKHDGWGSSSNPSTTTAHSATDPDDASTTQAPQQQQARPPPPPKFTQKLEPKVRQPGDPIYDRLLIGGTTSLGFLMWIGATIVLIMSLVGHADYKNARTSDFRSLGPQGCRVENSTRYTFWDKKLDALNKVCVEEWEYQVHVVAASRDDKHSFVSSVISLESCRDECDLCLRQNWLFGPNYYPGSDPTKRGTYLGSINESTLVECWESTIPMEELSGFYDPYCHNQHANSNNNESCFVLYDTAVLLEQEKNSSQVGLYSAYACYAGGALLLLVVGFFMLRNKQVREAELGPNSNNKMVVYDDDIEQHQEQNTTAVDHQDQKEEESNDEDITNNNNKKTQQEGGGVPDQAIAKDASLQLPTTVVEEEAAFYKT